MSTTRIKVNVIAPMGFFSGKKGTAKLDRVIDNAMDEIAENMRVDMAVTTQTWKDQPYFVVRKAGRVREIFTSNLIYKFISGGTRVRYATMTKNFVAKTRVRWIGSGQGAGSVAFISKRHPRPGIKAREYPQEIIVKWKKRIALIVQTEVAKEVTR